MPTLREFLKEPDVSRNLPEAKFQYWNNVVKYSPKYRSMDAKARKKVFNELVPKLKGGITSGEGVIKTLGKAYKSFKQIPGIKQGDIAVEAVSRFIEPKVPAGRTIPGLLAKDLPRQVIADIARAYKPSTLIPFVAGAKAIKPIARPIGRFISKVTPEPIKKSFLRQFTVGKGQPKAFQELRKKANLEKAIGGREAIKVAEKLSLAPKDMKIISRTGKVSLIKKGKTIPLEQQEYVGRIFRKEIDLGGKQTTIFRDPEITRRITKNIEVEEAFNPVIQKLNKELNAVNTLLRNKELRAEALVGKKFITPGGTIEKATGVSKVPKILKSGKESTKRFKIGVETEFISPILAGTPGEQIVRGVSQVSKAFPKFTGLSRKELLSRRKFLSRSLQVKKEEIHLGVRSNYDIFDRTFSEQIRTNPKFKELSAIADEGRIIMDKWSKALTASGIPKEQTKEIIEKNIGEYMARMFRSKLKTTGTGFGTKSLRLRLGGLKHKKDLSEAVLRRLGEFKTPALPTAIRVKEISTSIANNKLFSQVAKNPEWVAAKNTTGKLIQMADTPAMGALRAKFVVPEIAQEINAINQATSQAMRIYSKALGAWKYGKVVLNPSTHARNIMSNTMLLDLSGTNHIRQARLFPKAFREFKAKGNLYKNALDDGAFGGEFVGGDVMAAVDDLQRIYETTQGSNLQKWMSVIKRPFKKAGDVYQAEEQLAKLVKYIDVLERGGTRQVAAEAAQRALFNYTEIPNIIKLAKQGAPFITFTYKAIPRIGEALVERPLAVYKYYALANAINETSRKFQGMTTEEFARQKKVLPPWMLKDIGGMPTNLLMPWKDEFNRTQWLNLEYILPIGMLPEVTQKGLQGFVSNPLFNIVADLTKNTDFRGKEIIPIGATKAEATAIVTDYLYKQLTPSLAPGLKGYKGWGGGYSFSKIMNSIDKVPDFADRVRNVPTTLFDTLVGLKVTSLDADEAESFRMYEKKKQIDNLKNQARKLNHPAISEEYREKKTEEIFQKIQKIIDGI